MKKFRYVQGIYEQTIQARDRVEEANSIQIVKDQEEVEKLVMELDQLKQSNFEAEEEQMSILDQISKV